MFLLTKTQKEENPKADLPEFESPVDDVLSSSSSRFTSMQAGKLIKAVKGNNHWSQHCFCGHSSGIKHIYLACITFHYFWKLSSFKERWISNPPSVPLLHNLWICPGRLHNIIYRGWEREEEATNSLLPQAKGRKYIFSYRICLIPINQGWLIGKWYTF